MIEVSLFAPFHFSVAFKPQITFQTNPEPVKRGLTLPDRAKNTNQIIWSYKVAKTAGKQGICPQGYSKKIKANPLDSPF